LVVVVVVLGTQQQFHSEQSRAGMAVLAIYLQAEQEAHQLLQTQAAQEAVVVDILPLAVTHQEMMAVLAEMAEAEAEALTTQEHQVLAAMA
jgi:hypothetical protein